jgi:hypothetical protein
MGSKMSVVFQMIFIVGLLAAPPAHAEIQVCYSDGAVVPCTSGTGSVPGNSPGGGPGLSWTFPTTDQPDLETANLLNLADQIARWIHNVQIVSDYVVKVNANIEQIKATVKTAASQIYEFNEKLNQADALDAELVAADNAATTDSNHAVDAVNLMFPNGVAEGSGTYVVYKAEVDHLNEGKRKLAEIRAIRDAWQKKSDQRYSERKKSIDPAKDVESRVYDLEAKSLSSLKSPEVSSKLKPETTQWIQEQIYASEEEADHALSMAWAGTASDETIQSLDHQALYTVQSIDAFVSGVAAGTYPGLKGTGISVGQAAQAIYPEQEAEEWKEADRKTLEREAQKLKATGENYEARKQSIDPARNTYSEVFRIKKEARTSLNSPEVSSRLQPEASKWIAHQLKASEDLAYSGVQMAVDGTASDTTIQLLGNYALATVNSIHDFLSGVGAGLKGTAISMAQAAQAIYNNPALVNVLAVRTMYSIQHPYGGAGMAASVKSVFVSYYAVFKTGSAEDIGKATGELVPNILLAIATDGTSTVEATALEGVAAEISEAGIAGKVGTQLVQDVQATPALTGEMAEVDAAAKGIVDSAKAEGFTRVRFPRGAGAATGAVPQGYVPVSRWVSEAEAEIWEREGATRIPQEVGTLVEPNNVRLYVTRPGAPRPGNTGAIRIDFFVPEKVLRIAGNGEWQQIIQPVANLPIYNVKILMP